MGNYTVNKIDENTWSIDNEFVRCFVLTGNDIAILIDTGVSMKNIMDVVREITDLPVQLLSSHGDMDHVSCHGEFDWFYMHKGDAEYYKKMHPDSRAEIRYIAEGDKIDLGGRTLEIYDIPGHTKGSIAILDVEKRVLYPGDTVQVADIFLFGAHRCPEEFPASLMKIDAMADKFDKIYGFHGTMELPADFAGKVFDDYEAVLHGEVEGTMIEKNGQNVMSYRCPSAGFLCEMK